MTKNNHYYFPLPPSLNAIYKPGNKKIYKATKAKNAQDDIVKLVKMVYGLAKINHRVQLNIILALPNKKVRDLDGYLKLLFDGLKNNAFNDDSDIYHFAMDKLISSEIKTGLYVKIEAYRDIQAKLLNICKSANKY